MALGARDLFTKIPYLQLGAALKTLLKDSGDESSRLIIAGFGTVHLTKRAMAILPTDNGQEP